MDQKEKVIATLIKNRDVKDWHYAPDFMKPESGDLFVGYEASARMTDVVKQYPAIIASKKDGKYRYIRFRWEDLDWIMQNSAPAMIDFLDTCFSKYGVQKVARPFQDRGLFE